MFCLSKVSSTIIAPEMGHQDRDDVKNVILLVKNKQLLKKLFLLLKKLAESKEPKATEKVEMETIATNTEDTVENTVNTNDSVERSEETKVVTAEVANVLVGEPDDEMCPDNIYRGHGNEKPPPSSI